MKDPYDRTKVVVRHLPPALSQSVFLEQIDGCFAGRYKWFCFRPGKNSLKSQRHARAYIDFNAPEDVVEFAEFFDGHVFVNEKGAQFKTIVEYAPSQRIPKLWSKTDGREGTIHKDPEYLEFLDHIAKPIENLPNAEIQLERKEAEERAGGPKETIITPLMDFVRQKRAAKGGSQRASTNGRLRRLPGNSSSTARKRTSEKRKGSTSMYVLREKTKGSSGKEKSNHLLMQRRDDQQLLERSIIVGSAFGREISDDETGKKRLLLKGKERELYEVSGVSQHRSVMSPMRNSQVSVAFKQNQRRDASGRVIKSILSNKEARQNQSPASTGHSDQQMQTVNSVKDKRPPRATSIHSMLKDNISSISPPAVIPDSDSKRTSDDKFHLNDMHGIVSEKQDRRTRSKDRPDRGIWAPLRRSDGLHASDESMSLSSSMPLQFTLEGMSISQHAAPGASKVGDDVADNVDAGNNSSFPNGKSRSVDGGYNSRLGRGGNSLLSLDEMKMDIPNASKSGEIMVFGSGRNSHSSMENGSHRHVGRRGPVHGLKDIDGSLNFSEGKPSKRSGGTGYGSNEKQVWVQKSGSGP